jgi:hypothetical protein
MTEVEFMKRAETIPPLPIQTIQDAHDRDPFFSALQSPLPFQFELEV